MAWYQRLAIVLLALLTAVGLALAESKSTAEDTPSDAVLNPLRVITDEDTTSAISQTAGKSPQVEIHQQPAKRCHRCRERRPFRVGGGGGFSGGYLFANLDEINSQVRRMGIEELSEDLVVFGGKGYARIGCFIIGGGGYGSTVHSSGIPDGCARYAEVEIGYGGVILGFSHAKKQFELTGGVLLGAGGIAVERRRNSRYVFGWNDAWDVFDTNRPDSVATEDLNVTSRLTADFIAIEPFVTIKYQLLPFMAAEISASYLRARIGYGQWKIDNIKIPDSPKTDIGGPSIRFGLHFGV